MNAVITLLIWMALLTCALITFVGPILWAKRWAP